MLEVLDMLPEFDVLEAFEEALRSKSLMNDLGYFTGEVARDDNDDLIIRLRVAAMVDTAGEDDFRANPELACIRVDWPEESVDFKVVDTAPVSGMEVEVIYKPFPAE